MRFSIPLVIASGVLAVSVAAASGDGSLSQTTLTVPTDNYTVLHFSQPVVKAVLPPGAPVVGKPYFMSNDTVLLLMFRASKHPVQAVVQLEDGTTHILSLQPKRGADAQINVPNTDPQQAVSVLPAVPPSRNPAAGVVPVLSSLVSGKVPSGWSPQSPDGVPKLRYDRLTATPVAAWDGGDARVVQYQVSAVGKQASVVDPSQFYLPGVEAAMLDGSRIAPGHFGTLYLLTKTTAPTESMERGRLYSSDGGQ